ncbi:MAG: hypothetical protein J6T57_02980 [Alphaproteobacteria bacterium]|nr:hypothetical protein [Alphaproteobacteria bacterium]
MLRYLVAIFVGLVASADVFGDSFCGEDNVCDGDINITETTTFENYGEITGNIIVDCTGCAIDFHNFGIISGNIIIADGASPLFSQTITGNSDANVIGNLTGHTVDVYGGTGIDMAKIIATASGADNVVLHSGSFIVGPGIPPTDAVINVNNFVSFIIVGANDDQDVPLLTHIWGEPSGLQVNGIDSMFSPNAYIDENGNLFLRLERISNYDDIIGGGLGEFVDSLQDSDENDKLVTALNSAQSRNELNAILKRSVRTNPILLARPIRTIATYDDIYAFNDGEARISVRPFYLAADEFNVWGANADFAGNVSKNVFGYVGAVFGRLNFDGELDDYSGVVYGGRIGAVYNDGDFYAGVRGVVIGMATHDLSVFDGATTVHNPNAMVSDLIADFGLVFKILDDINITPFVGVRANYANVLDEHETNAMGRIGFETMVNNEHDGNRYGVGLRAVMHTDGTVNMSMRTDIVSPADGIGAGLDIGSVYDDMGWSFRFMLNGRVLF